MSAISSCTFLSLPTEVQYLVYSHLDKEDSLSLSSTCRHLRNIYYDERIKKHLFKQHFPQFSFQEDLPASDQYARAMAQVHCLGLTCLQTLTNAFDKKILCLAISDDGKKAFSTSTEPVLTQWSIENDHMKLQTNFYDTQDSNLLACDCEGKKGITSSRNVVRIWDFKIDSQHNKRIEYFPPNHRNTYVAMNRQGTMAAIGLSNHTIQFLDLTKDPPNILQTVNGHNGQIVCIVFRPDGKKAISLCSKGILNLWDLNESPITCEQKHTLHKKSRFIVMVPDESRVICTTGKDLQVYDFSMPEPSHLKTLTGHNAPITCLASDFANRRVFSGSKDKTINIWQIGQDDVFLSQTIQAHKKALSCLAITPDGSLLLSGENGPTIKMWRLNSLPHEQITRALERCNSSEESPLDELPQFAKRNIYELLYKKLRYSNPEESKAKRRKILKSELTIREMSETELMSWGDEIFQETTFMQEKKDSLEAYRDCLKSPGTFPELPIYRAASSHA